MIGQPAFPVEPWCLRETELKLELLAQAESVFALSNGHIGWRANLDEGEPHGLPGSYLNGVYEVRPLPYAEPGYGFPESGQTVVNVTNGKVIRLLVDDEPLDIRYGELRSHERLLDFRSGVLSRSTEWVSPAGRLVRINRSASCRSPSAPSVPSVTTSSRSTARRGWSCNPSSSANEQLPDLGGDPRVAAALKAPLRSEQHGARGTGALLVHCTKKSGLRVGGGDEPRHRVPGGLRDRRGELPRHRHG